MLAPLLASLQISIALLVGLLGPFNSFQGDTEPKTINELLLTLFLRASAGFAEEFIFRGYFQRQMTTLFRSEKWGASLRRSFLLLHTRSIRLCLGSSRNFWLAASSGGSQCGARVCFRDSLPTVESIYWLPCSFSGFRRYRSSYEKCPISRALSEKFPQRSTSLVIPLTGLGISCTTVLVARKKNQKNFA